MAFPITADSASAPNVRVHLLDPHTINQIAAGEVVERPASVVKELVENALDAGARRIEVELTEAGRGKIRVRDDGSGMVPEDIVSSLQRHATSKISRIEDLGTLVSLGFRGEALPSIASVSRMRIRSSVTDGLTWGLVIEGGEQGPLESGSGPRGTEIVVEDLFFNTPARLKFMKSDATELAACVDIVQKLAVAYPSVAFKFRHGMLEMFATAGDGDVLGGLAEIWGRDAARALAPVDHFENNVRVRGWISPPHFTKGTRQYQWFFVNGRAVRSRGLQVAMDLAYRMLTPEKRYPLAMIALDIEPGRVDANVSPTKMEVRFQQESGVMDAVRHGIKQALLEHGMIPDAGGIARANEAIRETCAPPFGSVSAAPPVFAPGFGSLGGNPGSYEQPGVEGGNFASAVALLAGSGLGEGVPRESAIPFLAPETPPGENAYSALLDGLRVVGQAANMYILAENRQGLLVVDQHVAHERILYEMIRNARGQGMIERQPLLVPETLHLDRRTFELVKERIEELDGLGFALEVFGGETLLVRSVPAAIRRKNPVSVLREIIDELVGGVGADSIVSARENLWIMCSCKMAVKAGDPLSVPEMEKLLWDLAQTENPYLCPHGRPITLLLRHEDLLRKFKRH